jgi:hypothetical protein
MTWQRANRLSVSRGAFRRNMWQPLARALSLSLPRWIHLNAAHVVHTVDERSEKVVQLGSRAQRGGSESRGAIIFVRGVRCSWKREPTWREAT